MTLISLLCKRLLLLCNKNILSQIQILDDWDHSVKHPKFRRFLLLCRQCCQTPLQASCRRAVHPMSGIRYSNRTKWDFIHPFRHLPNCVPSLLRIQLSDTTDLSEMVLDSDRPLPRILFTWLRLHYLHLPVLPCLPMHGVFEKEACSLRGRDIGIDCHDNSQLLHLVGDNPWWSTTAIMYRYLHASPHDYVQLCRCRPPRRPC